MQELEKYFLQPGYVIVSEKPLMIHTVLGSCISVCLWDAVEKVGGMNHYIYSRARDNIRNCRYGDVSVRHLFRMMLDMGVRKENLRAHLIGGAMHSGLDSAIGEENIAVAEEFLSSKKVQIVSRDVGGSSGRKVVFNSSNGEILVYKGINIRKSDWYNVYGEKD